MSRNPGVFGSRVKLSLEYSSRFYSERRPTLSTVWSVELVGSFIAKGYLGYHVAGAFKPVDC